MPRLLWRVLAFSVAAMLGEAVCSAQTALSWKEIQERFRANNPNLMAGATNIQESRANVKAAGVEDLVSIKQQDIFTLDLSGADVVTLFLLPRLNVKLIPQLEKLTPGARIVSHGFPTPGLIPDKVESVVSAEDDVARNLYLWTTPLKKEAKKD